MNDKIFIPKKCKVGFQPRTDTYTKKLGYVIYNDGKIWRKEKSWLTWCIKSINDQEYEQLKKIQYDNVKKNNKEYYERCIQNPSYKHYVAGANSAEEYAELKTGDYQNFQINLHVSADPALKPFEFDNVPTSGFVLNKKVGGATGGWNPRQTYTRVYDPRGFEFEISIPNLLYILENTNSIKGKGLEGNFIYGWSGTELTLIPENAPEYKEMLNFTTLQNTQSLGLKSLIVGNKYQFSSGLILTYMGKHDHHDYYGAPIGKDHAFVNDSKHIEVYKTCNTIKLDLGIDPNYANKLSYLQNDKYFNANNRKTLEAVTEKEGLQSILYVYYTKSKDGYKQVYIQKHNYFTNTQYQLGRKYYSDFKSLLDKHKLFKLKYK